MACSGTVDNGGAVLRGLLHRSIEKTLKQTLKLRAMIRGFNNISRLIHVPTRLGKGRERGRESHGNRHKSRGLQCRANQAKATPQNAAQSTKKQRTMILIEAGYGAAVNYPPQDNKKQTRYPSDTGERKRILPRGTRTERHMIPLGADKKGTDICVSLRATKSNRIRI
jgi:hypothetical protein